MAKAKLTREQKIKKRRRTRRKLTGFIFLCFAVLGVVFIASLVLNQVRTLLDDTDERMEYASLIAPIVAMDPVPFDSLEKANGDMLLEAAIWSTFNNEDTEKYSRNEFEQLLIPTIDVDRWASRMYGPSFRLNHRTFSSVDDESMTFQYDETMGVYVIPITSQAGGYTPVVESIATEGNSKLLRVAYVQQDSSLMSQTGEMTEESVYKYMEYVMIRDAGGYYLYAIRTVAE